MIRFYAPDIETEGCLPADESSHCARVLRRREGDEVEVVDGKGFAYTCRIADANPRRVALEVVGKRSELPHWGRKITLAVAPTKNADRMEWLAERWWRWASTAWCCFAPSIPKERSSRPTA